MNETLTSPDFDVRGIPCAQKHPMIFQRWEELPVGAHFVLINDHDPVPLFYQFQALFPQAFRWERIFHTDKETRVRVTRLQATAPRVAPASGSTPRLQELDLDLRGLVPPEPLVRILGAIGSLAPGESVRALTDRKPLYLLEELRTSRWKVTCSELDDGSWLTQISA